MSKDCSIKKDVKPKRAINLLFFIGFNKKLIKTPNNMIQIVDEKRIMEIMLNKNNPENKGLFLAKDDLGGRYVACDNRNAEAFMEDFAKKSVAEKWLQPSPEPTENRLTAWGFVLAESYGHDQFHTNRYIKGNMQVEFTYEADTLVSRDILIEQTYIDKFSIEALIPLDQILNSK